MIPQNAPYALLVYRSPNPVAAHKPNNLAVAIHSFERGFANSQISLSIH
jgi:hypothetical protein